MQNFLKRWMMAVSLTVVASVLPARAWDDNGHMIVDAIAWEKLQPAAREKAAHLATLVNRTHNRGEAYNFVTLGAWMDDMRAEPGYAWSKWHYVNGPFTPTGTPFVEPEPPHILWAIDQAEATLKATGTTEQAQAEALGFLVHLVGDLHQPLHSTTWDDQGGNGYLISGVPFGDPYGKKAPNLHSFWDRAFRFSVRDGQVVEEIPPIAPADRPTAPGVGPVKALADGIMAKFPESSLPQLGAGLDHRAWVQEGHRIGCLFVYPPRPKPDNTEVVKLEPEYVQRAQVIAQQQVALAGYRLAALLNALLAK